MLQNKKISVSGKKLENVLSIGGLLISLFFLFPTMTNAETRVYSDDVSQGGSWNKAGSPYILDENIRIPNGTTLYIGEGVEISSGPYLEEYGPNTLSISGDLTVAGSKESPVRFNNLYSIYFNSNNSSIRNAIFTGTGMDFHKSTSTIESVTIKGAFEGIYAKGSVINISNSNLINNSYGIASYILSTAPVFLVKDNTERVDGIGGIGNALIALSGIDPRMIIDQKQNSIKINNSTISGNSQFGILNQTVNRIDAVDNWWGNANGPYIKGSGNQAIYGDRVSGLVDVIPWKDTEAEETPECCSNIVFIPGFEASRLYKDKTIASIKVQDMLWEPNANSDIKDLMMDSSGISVDTTIYTKDIIDSAYGLKNIHRNFIISMDKLVSDGIIKAWIPLAYDWRNSVTDMVASSTLAKIYDIASTSKNKKVTVIAHSNGGLVTKAIVKKLEQAGKSDMIERIIFVAVPELGTPQAILGMLHGYSQSLAGGLFLSESTARDFSQNVPGAYGLLPSKKFFENNPITVITDMFSKNLNRKISSYDDMKDFLLNGFIPRKAPTDINIPNTLNSLLLSVADSIHAIIDSWKPASTTKTVSIIGWGLPTSSAVTYSEDPHCSFPGLSSCDVEFLPTLIDDGDGTVITKSNAGNSDTTIFFNLKQLKEDTDKNIKHLDIMESPELFSKIKDVVTNTATNTASIMNSYEKYFSTTKPISSDKYLTLVIHSPVDVDVYDAQGRHTGLIASTTSNSIEKFENQIPGSYYGSFGRVKLVRIPYDTRSQIALTGNDAGVFSVDASISENDIVLATTSWSEMPVTLLTNIDLIIPTSTESFKKDILMNMDIDGDGITDFTNRTDEFLNATGTDLISDLPTYLASLRKIITSLKLPANQEKILLNRIDKLENVLEKKRFKKAEKVTKKLSAKIFKNKKINNAQKSAIIAKVEELLLRLEKIVK